jgi:hypothetical protein
VEMGRGLVEMGSEVALEWASVLARELLVLARVVVPEPVPEPELVQARARALVPPPLSVRAPCLLQALPA